MYKKKGETKEYAGLFGQRRLLIACTTLVGTVVGAGILGIPYVVAKAGLFYGLLIILVLGILFVFLNLFGGEVVLRTKKQCQLTGYAEKYLGNTGKLVMTFTMFFTIYGALTAYMIGEGETIRAMLGFGHPFVYTILFFIVVFFIVTKGVKATGRAELILISLLVLVIIFIGIFSYNKIDVSHFTTFNPAFLFLPYGVVLFAYMALPSIPELQEELGKKKNLMKKAIISGSIIPIVLYLVFAVVVVGIVGLDNFEVLQPNERIATIALSLYSNPVLGIAANILAILAMFTSFLTLAIALVEIYHYDYGVNRKLALGLTFIIPLGIAFLQLSSFITLLAVTGAVAGGLEGLMMVLMFWRAKKLGDRKPEYTMGNHYVLGGLLILMFVVGMFQQMWALF
jgi:tyrosine-specific transport protein